MNEEKMAGKCEFKFRIQKPPEKLSPKEEEKWVKRNLKAALKNGNILIDQFRLTLN